MPLNIKPIYYIMNLKFKEILNIYIYMNFYLFGYPIKNSPSPKLHNFIFQEFNLNHTYQLFETQSVDDIINSKFKGASITIPF